MHWRKSIDWRSYEPCGRIYMVINMTFKINNNSIDTGTGTALHFTLSTATRKKSNQPFEKSINETNDFYPKRNSKFKFVYLFIYFDFYLPL